MPINTGPSQGMMGSVARKARPMNSQQQQQGMAPFSAQPSPAQPPQPPQNFGALQSSPMASMAGINTGPSAGFMASPGLMGSPFMQGAGMQGGMSQGNMQAGMNPSGMGDFWQRYMQMLGPGAGARNFGQ